MGAERFIPEVFIARSCRWIRATRTLGTRLLRECPRQVQDRLEQRPLTGLKLSKNYFFHIHFSYNMQQRIRLTLATLLNLTVYAFTNTVEFRK